MKLKYFTPDQMKKIYHALDQDPLSPEHILIEILALTGVRADELLRIQIFDIDFQAKRFTLHKASKGSESRTCPLGLRLTQRIAKIVEDMNLKPNDFLVSILSDTVNVDSLTRMLRFKFQRLKAQIWPGQRLPGLHGLRHTVAKKVYDKTKDVYAVKEALGHTTVASTQRYMTSFNHESLHSILAERY